MNSPSILMYGLMMTENVKTHNNEKQKEILNEWEKSKKYPRKKKKKVRKDLEFQWAIFSYDPCDFMSF